MKMSVFGSVVRWAAAAVVRLPGPLARDQRNYHYGLVAALHQSSAAYRTSPISSIVPTLRYSTATKSLSADESLIRVIDTEIKCAEETDNHDRVDQTPSGFPFKIDDNPGDQTVTLTRVYDGEQIKVEAHMPSLVTGDEDDHDMDDDHDPDRAEKPSQSSVPLVVTLSKKIGPCLEFQCTAFPDKIAINDMAVRYLKSSFTEQIAYEGPAFRDLEQKLQKSFHKYLEMRGIKPSLMNFLHEYMINKDSREYLLWLKNLKKFVHA